MAMTWGHHKDADVQREAEVSPSPKALISAVHQLTLLLGRQILMWEVRLCIGLGFSFGFTQPRGQEQGSQRGSHGEPSSFITCYPHLMGATSTGHPSASSYLRPG